MVEGFIASSSKLLTTHKGKASKNVSEPALLGCKNFLRYKLEMGLLNKHKNNAEREYCLFIQRQDRTGQDKIPSHRMKA